METRDRMIEEASYEVGAMEGRLSQQAAGFFAYADEISRLRATLKIAMASPEHVAEMGDCVAALLKVVEGQPMEEAMAGEEDILEYRSPGKVEKNAGLAILRGERVVGGGLAARVWGTVEKKRAVSSCPIKINAWVGAETIHLQCPRQLAIDEAALYVVDSDSHRVVVLDKASLSPLRFLDGTTEGDDGVGGRFNNPMGLVIDEMWLYVSELGGDCVRALDKVTGGERWSVGYGTAEQDEHGFRRPGHVAVDDDHVYVPDMAGRKIVVLRKEDGRFVRSLAFPLLGDPLGLALDREHPNHLYISDCRRHCIWEVGTTTGVVIRALGMVGEPGDGVDQFRQPRGIVVSGGHVMVCDSGNNRVVVLDKETGGFVAVVGGGEGGFNGFNKPQAVVVDKDGKMLVSDYGNRRVCVVDGMGGGD